ncbi:energy transducer TonB [Dysgonomonas gadei]|jgi:protein TonB|uniref:TonB C-terminal domain-containing protein n=1 Tax=Dysgonomonas gadei ATCC BAA-286 TaxID=742766 RepID=F5IZ50_9BACT|nr:energy transducer TonB [Dysgonomonas gadei]EGK01339.1 hypothetical protein HMPREF9455_02367 [Dysgonomonas gadei ATCC BAA-286]
MVYQKQTDNYDKNGSSGKKSNNNSFVIKALTVLFIAVAAFAVFYFYNDKPEKSTETRQKRKSEVIRESKAVDSEAEAVEQIAESTPTEEFTPPVIEEDTNSSKPFITVEQMPRFPGGEAAMHKFINENLKIPASVYEPGIQGRVTIRFVVSKTGEVTDVTVIRGVEPAYDKEVARVIRSMPKWIPGKQNGVTVPVYFTLPILIHFKQ